MPIKAQITREAILQAAFQLARTEGLAAVNARRLAGALGCSTQPLYRAFQGMDELLGALRQRIDRAYDDFVAAQLAAGDTPLARARAHVLFARRERPLYTALFLAHAMDGVSLAEIARAPWNQTAVQALQRDLALQPAAARQAFLQLWLFASGLAAQLAANDLRVSEGEIDALLADFYEGMRCRYAHQ